ncbi:MAG: hypothetical protein ACR2GJ_01780 [Gemmatimonadaceae bacterium]
MTPGPGEAGRAGNGSSSGEFDAFLAALAGVVAERVQALGSKPVAEADPVFFDESKTIIEWPELSAYVIEELR